LPAGFEGTPWRSTASTVFCVVEGRGRAAAGESVFEWGANDVFVVPNWTACSLAAEAEAVLFSYSDAAALERLGLLRAERLEEAGG